MKMETLINNLPEDLQEYIYEKVIEVSEYMVLDIVGDIVLNENKKLKKNILDWTSNYQVL